MPPLLAGNVPECRGTYLGMDPWTTEYSVLLLFIFTTPNFYSRLLNIPSSNSDTMVGAKPDFILVSSQLLFSAA